MGDRLLMISWGSAVRGREERALDTFNEAVGLYGRMHQDGRIESFDVAVMRPNSDLAGFIILHGSGSQIDAVHDDPEYLRMLADAQMIVEDLRACDGYAGQGVATLLGIMREAIGKVPQAA
jgi:hypothetical protein